MTDSFLALRRLRIMKSGRVVYDQAFHLGVNIIRGENGSGKSTIADFIFFVLGGEFDSWKEAAGQCDEVQAEVEGSGGFLTIRRSIGTKLEAPTVFLGRFEDAVKSALEGWERYPIRRTQNQLSFSQVLFRACHIPEAPSLGSSNITAHQILRLMYGDQRTPAARLFRFESFDTRDIRTAVGELLVGINGYELYEIQLELRSLEQALDEKERQLHALLVALPSSEVFANLEALHGKIFDVERERNSVLQEISDIDDAVPEGLTQQFLNDRRKAILTLNRLKAEIAKSEAIVETNGLEIAELQKFISFLSELREKLASTDKTSHLIGAIEFSYCPACLTPVTPEGHPNECVVCHAPINPEGQHSKYLEIRVDTDMQVRESTQLLDAKRLEISKSNSDLRVSKKAYDAALSEFVSQYDVSNSPREAFLAERNNRLGQIKRDLVYLENLRELATKIENLSNEKAELASNIERLKARLQALQHASSVRLKKANALISGAARKLLMADLPRQDEFMEPANVILDFGDDAIFVDGKLNFAESSNVVLKNAALLSLLAAATIDENFWHPKFLLLDNVEDKGMEEARSHNFQRLIVDWSNLESRPHQVIFMTSTINRLLEVEEYVIGPKYTKQSRTLMI